MSKELNIIQAMEMPVGSEFKVIHDNGRTNRYKAILGMEYDYKFLKWDNGEYLNLTSKNLNSKFIPIQKPVSFMEVAEYVIKNKTTIRATAKKLGYSKTTIQTDLRERLPIINPNLYKKVAIVLATNKAERALRGGMAIKNKYKTNGLT